MKNTDTVREDSAIKFAVVTQKLSKNYGGFAALKDLSISIPKGTIYGLLGPNGAGKTTIVRILCGLLNASSGEVQVLGSQPGKQISPEIGYMPQDLALYVDLSVLDNMKLYGNLAGLKGNELSRRIDELLELVGLSNRKNSMLSSLSGGMKRKISLVCSLMHNPRLLILDEPTVGVDPLLRANLWEYFETLRRSGSTIIITTHYMDEAFHCDVVGFIHNGSLLTEARPGEILQKTGKSTLEEAFIMLAGGPGS